MKKFKILIILLITSLFICSCSNNFYAFEDKKPNKNFYTSELMNSLSFNSKCHSNIVYMNLYKGIKLEEDELLTARKFLKYLKEDNFIDKPEDLPEFPAYKMYFTFEDSKYVINVYNQKYISVYPWDGKFEMDFIDMSESYTSYNLFNLCDYVLYK